MTTKQGDLFYLDSPLYGNVRGERSVMEHPFFALTKIAHMTPIVYRIEDVSVEVRPSTTGIATIYDKEILLYIASLMAEKIQKGEAVEQDFVFTAHDFFRVTGTSPSKRSYERLDDALERLQGTQIKTNIKAGGVIDRGWFSWLSEANAQYVEGPNGEERLKAVKVRLCNWLYRAILKDRRILTYHHDYFRLSPIERRMYEVARSHCDDGPYAIEIEQLCVKVGCNNEVRLFKRSVRECMKQDSLPEYAVDIVERDVENPAAPTPGRRRKKTETIVVFTPRAKPVGRRTDGDEFLALAH